MKHLQKQYQIYQKNKSEGPPLDIVLDSEDESDSCTETESEAETPENHKDDKQEKEEKKIED